MPAREPPTFNIQDANDIPFGLLTSSIVSTVPLPRFAVESEKLATVGQTAGFVPVAA
jgi:hypothetical protein